MRCLLVALFALVMATGCEPTVATTTPALPQSFGRFEGNVIAAWDTDGRNMILREDFAYIDSFGKRWQAPANSVINGASIPQGFWTFIGGPFEGKYRNASVVHDVGCHLMTDKWEDVHRMFYEACLCGGVDETQAKMMYYAVYHFGPRWQTVTETQMQTEMNENHQLVQTPVSVQTVVRQDPVPPTPEEIEQVAQFVSEDHPDAALIQQTTREELHRRPYRGGRHCMTGGNLTRTPHEPGSAARGHRYHREAQAVTAEEQLWANQLISAHLLQQAGQAVPMEALVVRTSRGYRANVQYLLYDEQGQPYTYPGGNCVIWISREGEIREVASGAFSTTMR
jgi:hypothetical protein